MAYQLVTVEHSVSAERLAPYRRDTATLAEAVRLYEWNAAVSAALWLDIGHCEVLVRNALHTQMTAWSTRVYSQPRWYLNPGRVLHPEAVADIAVAHKRLTRANKPHEAGRVVAELSFGFWRFLVASVYDRALWKPALIHGFPGQPRRRPVHTVLANLHKLRNRLAHHEPVHKMPLARYHTDLTQLVEWINPELREWVEHTSTVNSILAARP